MIHPRFVPVGCALPMQATTTQARERAVPAANNSMYNTNADTTPYVEVNSTNY